jgi:hypothetical protein
MPAYNASRNPPANALSSLLSELNDISFTAAVPVLIKQKPA